MLLGFQIWVVKQYVVGIICPHGWNRLLTELANSKWAKAHPAHPLTASLTALRNKTAFLTRLSVLGVP